MMIAADPWAALDDAVLDKFRSGDSLSTSEVLRALPDLTHREVRTALAVNVEAGYLEPRRGATHTTYTITTAGRKHLATAKVA